MDAGGQETALASSGVDAVTQTLVRVRIRQLVERATRWILQTHRSGIDIAAVVDELKPGVREVMTQLPELITEAGAERYQTQMDELTARGVNAELAERLARWSLAHAALPIVRVARRHGGSIPRCARVYFQLSERLGIERALRRSLDLPRTGHWEIMARAAMREELISAQTAIAAAALDLAGPDEDDSAAVIERWWRANPDAARQQTLLDELAAGPVDLARMSVAVASLRGLLETAQAG